MISNSVGKGGINRWDDVKTVQQIINLRDDLRRPLPKLRIDGRFGPKTQAAIDHIQSKIMQSRDGRIDPFGFTLKKMWPATYASPTGMAIRGKDDYGEGYHGAPRGRRTHDGSDYGSVPGQQVKAPLSGKIVAISKPYTSGIDASVLSGVTIEASDGTMCWVWYLQPVANIVDGVVKSGLTVIGTACTLQNRYKGITDHVHVRIHSRNGTQVDPATVIR